MRISALFLPVIAFGAPALADVTDDVRCREIGFSLAAEARDATRFASFIDADARFIGNSVMRGPDAVAEAWAVFFEDGGPSIRWRPRFIEVLENGGLALSRGPYRVTTTDEAGDPVEHWGTFNSVWRLGADGEWRIVFDAGSASDKPPGDEERALLEDEADCSTSGD